MVPIEGVFRLFNTHDRQHMVVWFVYTNTGVPTVFYVSCDNMAHRVRWHVVFQELFGFLGSSLLHFDLLFPEHAEQVLWLRLILAILKVRVGIHNLLIHFLQVLGLSHFYWWVQHEVHEWVYHAVSLVEAAHGRRVIENRTLRILAQILRFH